MPDVRYFPRPWPAYVLAYEGRADELGAVCVETWDRTDQMLVLICLRCSAVWAPDGAPPTCEHLTWVCESRRAAHIDSSGP